MQLIEDDTVAGDAEWDDGLDAEWKAVVDGVTQVLPEMDVKQRRLTHPTSLVELAGHPGQNTMSVSLSSGPIKAVAATMAEIACAVESLTDLVAYDIQTGSGLLDGVDRSGPRLLASASRLFLESRLMPNDSTGGTSGMFALLNKDELSGLRSTKGDLGRRSHVNELLPTLPSDRLRVIGQEWRYINLLCRDDFPELAIFVGQRMHKGRGHEITLVKDLAMQSERMAGSSAAEVEALTRGLSDAELWHRLSFVGKGTARMSDGIARAVAVAWSETEAALAHAIEHSLSAVFVVDHYSRKERAAAVDWIDEKPS